MVSISIHVAKEFGHLDRTLGFMFSRGYATRRGKGGNLRLSDSGFPTKFTSIALIDNTYTMRCAIP